MVAVRKKNVAKIESTYVRQQEHAGIATARKKKMLMRRLSVFIIFALFISYLIVSSVISQASLLDAKLAQKQHLKKQLASLKGEQKSLNDNISKLNNNDYIAKYARAEYFLSNKDEIIFNIPSDKTKNNH